MCGVLLCSVGDKEVCPGACMLSQQGVISVAIIIADP